MNSFPRKFFSKLSFLTRQHPTVHFGSPSGCLCINNFLLISFVIICFNCSFGYLYIIPRHASSSGQTKGSSGYDSKNILQRSIMPRTTFNDSQHTSQISMQTNICRFSITATRTKEEEKIERLYPYSTSTFLGHRS